MVYPPTNHQVLSRRPLDSVLSDSVHGAWSRGGREYFLKCLLWILLAGYTAVFYVVI